MSPRLPCTLCKRKKHRKELRAFINPDKHVHRLALTIVGLPLSSPGSRRMCKQCSRALSMYDNSSLHAYLKPFVSSSGACTVAEAFSTIQTEEISQREMLLVQAIEGECLSEASEIAKDLFLRYNWSFSLYVRGKQSLAVPCVHVEDSERRYESKTDSNSAICSWISEHSCFVSNACTWFVLTPPPKATTDTRCAMCKTLKAQLESQRQQELCLTPKRSRTFLEARESPCSRVPVSKLSRRSLEARYNTLAYRFNKRTKRMCRLFENLSAYKTKMKV
jgi:hypothetical protein